MKKVFRRSGRKKKVVKMMRRKTCVQTFSTIVESVAKRALNLSSSISPDRYADLIKWPTNFAMGQPHQRFQSLLCDMYRYNPAPHESLLNLLYCIWWRYQLLNANMTFDIKNLLVFSEIVGFLLILDLQWTNFSNASLTKKIKFDSRQIIITNSIYRSNAIFLMKTYQKSKNSFVLTC